ncbi:MAG: putative cysteine desulfurase [Candidatus Thorarchaeota archaeon]|nr:MAG: putative cysteine desulfurase [Candidatus Thorarchaeota archaeon]
MSVFNIKSDFTILRNNPSLAFFDSASTSLVPDCVSDSVCEFLKEKTVSSRRGAYKFAVEGSQLVTKTRYKLAKYLDCENSQISFQKSIASSISSLCLGYDWKKRRKSKIVISQGEENSVSVSLMRIAKILGLDIDFIPLDKNGELELNTMEKIIDDKTGIVAVSHFMVGTGNENPLATIVDISHEHHALVLSDVTQSIAYTIKSPVEIGADILLFSGNIGLLGPPGLTLQWIDSELGRMIQPAVLGGSSVSNVGLGTYETALQPDKFETGVLNVPGIVGLGSALDYISSLRADGYFNHLSELRNHLQKRLDETETVNVYGTPHEHQTIFGLSLGNDDSLSCHDVALFLDESDIYVRSGLICAHPLVRSLNSQGIIQVSIHCYNSLSDIDRLMDTLILIADQLM